MGAAQNSLMGVIGSLGTVAVASRMISNEASQQLNLGMQAQQEAVKIGKEMPEIKENMMNAVNQDITAHKEREALFGLEVNTPEDYQAYKELEAGVVDQEKMAKVALKTAEGEIRSKTDMLRRAKIRMKAARRWGGLM